MLAHDGNVTKTNIHAIALDLTIQNGNIRCGMAIFDHYGHIVMSIDSQYLRFNFLCFLHNSVYDHVAPDRDSDHTIYK